MTQENWKCHSGGSPEKSEGALRKGPWTKEEDEILLKLVKEKGIVKWTSIGKQTGLARSGKSCRLRWLNHLRPNLKKGSFTKEEENLIVCLHSKYGNKWTRIASKLPGRTDNEIKNFWNTRLKKCQKKQLPVYPQTMAEDLDSNPNFHNNCLNKTDFDQILQSTQTSLSSLHQFSSTLPHSWSMEPLLSPTSAPTQSFHSPSTESHFSSQNQFSPTHHQPTQPLLQQPSLPDYFSLMHHSRPASYQSMQGILSSPPMPTPPLISSLQKGNMSSLAGQNSISHSMHPLIMYPFMSSLDFVQFRHFKRSGGGLPRPLSSPLMSSTLSSQEPLHSSVSPLNINTTTQTSGGPTFQLSYSTAGPSNCSFIRNSLSGDMTWPSISRGVNDPVSPNSCFTLKSEPPSIQSYPAAALRDPCDTSLRQLNMQSMISLDLLNVQLQEELANRGCQNSRKEDVLGHNLSRERLLTECKKIKDSSNITRNGSLSNEISKDEIPSDEYSRKDGTWAQSSKTTDSSSDSSLNTENSSYKNPRRKEFMNIGSLTGLWNEGSDFTKCLKMKDSLLGENATIGCSVNKNFTQGESEQESRDDLLEEDSKREGLWTDSVNKDELVIGASSYKGDLWNKISNRDDLAETSVSQDINFLTSNACKQSLLKSQKQKLVLDEADDQNSTSFVLQSDGPGSRSSYIKTSTGEKEAIETEDHIDNELLSLLDFFPIAAELPEWYNTSQVITNNKATF